MNSVTQIDGAPWAQKKYERSLEGLHHQIKDMSSYLMPKYDTHILRVAAFNRVTHLMKWIYTDCIVNMFGSVASGIYLPNSDLDITVEWPNEHYVPKLDELAQTFRSTGFYMSVTIIDKTAIPLLKLVERSSGIHVDVSFNVKLVEKVCKWIDGMCNACIYLRPLVLILKEFLSVKKLNRPFNGGIPSYALVVMVAYFLKVVDRSALMPEMQSSPLGAFLVMFFDYYGRTFEYNTLALTFKNNQPHLKDKAAIVKSQPAFASSSLLTIVDPVDPENDLGRGAYNMLSVKNAFNAAAIKRCGPIPFTSKGCVEALHVLTVLSICKGMEPTNASVDLDASSPPIHLTNASQTEIRVEYIKHNWTVKNFSHCYQEYLENFVHLPRNEETLTWSIKIYPKGNGENNKDFVFLCLNRVINGVAKNKVGFRSRFFLKNNEGKDIEMRIHPNPSHSDYVSYIKRDVLFPQISPADSITVFVEIDVAVETITTSSDEQNYPRQLFERHQLGDDYLKLLTDDIHTDFTIRSDGKDIRVHKAILAARSVVFAAMLNHSDTNEAKSGILHIEDIEHSVLKEMLTFIYSGRCSQDMADMASVASDLLIAADKYGLEELKNNCEVILMQMLAFDNVCHLLIISDMYNAEKLRQRCFQYIIKYPKEITVTSGWEIVLKDHSHLVTDIVRNFDKNRSSAAAVGEPNIMTLLTAPNH